ncbi:MAG: aldehyde dehydrogenase family protein, partial [Bacteroidia bacterium]
MTNIQNYINGELKNPTTNLWLDNIEPATGKVYGRIPDSGKGDVQLAVNAAHEAFPAWANTSLAERHRLLEALAAAIEANLDE